MRGNPEVGDDAVDPALMVKLYEVLKVTEVLRNEGEALIVDDIGAGVLVLVKGIKVSGAEPFHNGPRVSAATEGDVGIYAFGLDVQAFNALVQ